MQGGRLGGGAEATHHSISLSLKHLPSHRLTSAFHHLPATFLSSSRSFLATFALPSCDLLAAFLQEATHRDRVVELERRVTNSRIKLHEQGRKTPVKPPPPATASIGSKAEVQVRAAGR